MDPPIGVHGQGISSRLANATIKIRGPNDLRTIVWLFVGCGPRRFFDLSSLPPFVKEKGKTSQQISSGGTFLYRPASL
jgi:hypothetical protein